MEISEDIFEFNFKDGMIRVQRHLVSNQTVYRIVFSDKRNPLVITRALSDNAALWWTSIAEGRQREAKEIGALIEQYFETKKMN
jgi:hypothetical protein